MAKAGVVLNLPEDQAEILGKKVNLELTTAVHYASFIMLRDMEMVE